MIKLGPILQRKRTYVVLKRIAEDNKSILFGDHATEFLYELVLVLVVIEIVHVM